MSNFPNHSAYSASASVPTFLDLRGNQTVSEVNDPPEDVCPKCFASSKDQPIHCISRTPAPPSYNIVSPRVTLLKGRLAVPVLNLQTSGQWRESDRPPRPTPVFRPDGGGRAQMRHRRNAFSPISPHISEQRIDDSRSSTLGLGISGASLRPGASPMTPGTAEKADASQIREDSVSDQYADTNLAQKVKEKLEKHNSPRKMLKRWLIEIISWVVSALSMAGIIIVLVIYRNRPLPHWPFGLTLNAYISNLSKIASAALLLPVSEALGQLKWNWFKAKSPTRKSRKMWDFELIDNASRGPWGAFILLGAAVTLFSLAMDPFFQQVVDFPTQWTIQSTDGLIARAPTYEIDSAGDMLVNRAVVAESDQSISAVTYHYFYDNGTNSMSSGKGQKIGSSVPLTCPNSRCTWSAYETLATCNRCVKNNDLLEFGCRNSSLDWITEPTLNDDRSAWLFPTGTACGWWLKSKEPILMTGYTTDLHTNYTGEVLLSRSQPLYDVWTRDPVSGYAAKLNDTRNPLAHFVVVSSEGTQQIRLNATPIAHECIFTWCIKTIESAYLSGVYNENVTSVVYNHTLGITPWSSAPIWYQGIMTGVEFNYTEDVFITGNSGHDYHVDVNTHINILQIFDDIFPSTYTVTNSTNVTDAELRFKIYVTSSLKSRILKYNPWLYNNISIHLDNMATDITNILRSAKGTMEMVKGPATDQVTLVLVRFEWLSLPLGLLGATFAFLATTIARSTMEQDIGLWKTSAMAILLNGLPDEIRKKVTPNKDKEEPKPDAKLAKLRWLSGTGWRLSGASAYSSSSPKGHYAPPHKEWK